MSSSSTPYIPLVSLVVPTYNRSELLSATLDSICNQSYPNWECLVVDDGSSDDSLAVLVEYAAKDGRIRFWSRQSPVKGAPACRNEGANAAKGELILFLDSDDLLGRECLNQRIDYISKQPSFDYWVFPAQVFHELPGDSQLLWNVPDGRNPLTRMLLSDPTWQTSSVMWTPKAIQAIGGWDEELISWQDWDYHLRALLLELSYTWFDQARPTFYYRKSHTSTAISKGNKKTKHLRARRTLFQKTYQHIAERDAWTADRREAFAYSYWLLAIQWVENGETQEALSLLKEAHTYGLMSASTYRKRRWGIRLASLSHSRIPILSSLAHKLYWRVYHLPLKKAMPRLMFQRSFT